MKILFVGDLVGRPGRMCLERLLPSLRKELNVDAVVVNAENAAGGIGVTPQILDELMRLGVEAITLGNHTWRKKELVEMLDRYQTTVRPANYPPGVPGQGSVVITLQDGRKFGLISVLGRIFMECVESPFVRAKQEAVSLRQRTPVVIVDMHAEATSEKMAMGWYLDGCCTAVLGTHTHVQTADERILPGGTAYITDVGMTGPRDSVIGLEKERAIHKFLTGIPSEFRVAGGPSMLSAALVEADETTGKALSIRRECRISPPVDN
ncbi:MAG: TIGR00282 family metallophosphoesterase [Candidatus Hydrogenedentes bacterium]|nr:TIGR00282 family metallophosphoesterase [Candidatus Hydrogenedentota bacterium]